MAEATNLAREIEKQLPTELVEFMQAAGLVAASHGETLYLVGGVVRDLLLNRPNLDLDLVVEGDAIHLAQQLVGVTKGKVVGHVRFQTANLKWDKWSVDIVTARSEAYVRPGALPTVKPGSLASDLFRRDFTINAMAVELVPGRYGQLIDLYGGRADLKHGLVRVLHDNSFTDDATRIWRALRYEQRLDFELEFRTLELLKRDISMLHTITGERIRHELELVLREELPEKVLNRAGELSVLTRLHPVLKGDDWLMKRFREARQLHTSARPLLPLYLSLLTYRMNDVEMEQLISYLRLPRLFVQTIRDAGSLKGKLELLAEPRLAPSVIYHLLDNYSPTAIMANLVADDEPSVQEYFRLFLTKLRYIKPALTGSDLEKMGVVPGPEMRGLLQTLHDARLDGKVVDKQEEMEMVRNLVRKYR